MAFSFHPRRLDQSTDILLKSQYFVKRYYKETLKETIAERQP